MSLCRSVAAEKVECEKLEIKKGLQSILAHAEVVKSTQELVRLLDLWHENTVCSSGRTQRCGMAAPPSR